VNTSGLRFNFGKKRNPKLCRPSWEILFENNPPAVVTHPNNLNLNPADLFGEDIQKFRNQFRSFFDKKSGEREPLEISVLNPENPKIVKQALALRNSVELLGIDVLVAALEEMGVIGELEYTQHGRHHIDHFAGLQSPMISTQNFQILINGDAPYIVQRVGSEKIVGTYIFTTQLSDGIQPPTPQEHVLFEDGGIKHLLDEEIVTHNAQETQNLATASAALRENALAYFATICVAPNARGQDIGTLLKYLTYRKAAETLRERNIAREIDSPVFGLQRYFSISGICKRKKGEKIQGLGAAGLEPIHNFRQRPYNAASAALNDGTYEHVGVTRNFTSVLGMISNRFDAGDAKTFANRKLRISPETLRGYYVGIDNLYVLVNLEQAIEHFRNILERKGMGHLLNQPL